MMKTTSKNLVAVLPLAYFWIKLKKYQNLSVHHKKNCRGCNKVDKKIDLKFSLEFFSKKQLNNC